MVGLRSLMLNAASGLLLVVGAPAMAEVPGAGNGIPAPTGGGTNAGTQPIDRRLALAERLSRSGALFYGAYWCGHCQHQKDLFGSQASPFLPYVECDRDDAGRRRCQKAGVRAYPTWVIGQERREGTLSLRALEAWLDQSSADGRSPAPSPRP